MQFAIITVTMFLILGQSAQAVYQVGDVVSDQCYRDVKQISVCLEDHTNEVRVLLYNAGWCGPCNQEFQELRNEVTAFSREPVKFISLSAQGWERKAPADQKFLMEWQSRHGIAGLANVIIASAPNDFGFAFFGSRPFIPNVAIIDRDGKLAYKAVNPGARAIISQIQTLLKR